MNKWSLLTVFCIFVFAGKLTFPQEPPAGPPQGTQFNTGADPKGEAKLQLKRGVEQFKQGHYAEAAESFARAKQLDPQLMNARLYLATAYATQYIPGAPSEDNRRVGERAVEEFKDVLAMDPNNLSALDGAGSMAFQMAGTPYSPEMFLESKTYHLKHIELNPSDPKPYYWIGVIDWTLSFRGNQELRKDYNEANLRKQIRETEPLPEKVRAEYAQRFGATIEEGVENLKKAIQLRPDYDDAIAYLNLVYRQKADTVSNEKERTDYLRMADELIDKVKEILQRRAQDAH